MKPQRSTKIGGDGPQRRPAEWRPQAAEAQRWWGGRGGRRTIREGRVPTQLVPLTERRGWYGQKTGATLDPHRHDPRHRPHHLLAGTMYFEHHNQVSATVYTETSVPNMGWKPQDENGWRSWLRTTELRSWGTNRSDRMDVPKQPDIDKLGEMAAVMDVATTGGGFLRSWENIKIHPFH